MAYEFWDAREDVRSAQADNRFCAPRLRCKSAIDVEAMEDCVDDAVASGRLEDEGLGAGGTGAGHQLGAQQLMGTVETDFNVGVGNIESLGGFAGAQLLEVAQDKNCPVRGRERQD